MLRTLLNGRKEKEQSKKGQGKEMLNDPALDDADRKRNLHNISEGHVEINTSRKDNCQLKSHINWLFNSLQIKGA